jgi:hypothetical protein
MGVDEIANKNSEIPVTALNPTTQYEKLVFNLSCIYHKLYRVKP